MLFHEKISNWSDWANVYHSIPAFEGIVKEILKREHLPICEIEYLTPGTNAVFKVGDVVLKIYAPKESGMDQTADCNTEIFVTDFAEKQGLPVPAIVAKGMVCDRYDFAYIVMKYIPGEELGNVLKNVDGQKQYELGKQMRDTTDKLNIPCEPFNGIDVIRTPDRSDRWKIYPDSFIKERRTYIDSHDYGNYVLVHGDLCMDNVLVGDNLVPIDYADAVLAPKCYEHALVFFEYHEYAHFLKGYFSGARLCDLTNEIFDGILIHDFGGAIINNAFHAPQDFTRLSVLKEKIDCMITKEVRGN